MQNKYVCNPYLPMQVCIPDGEPHVFGDRVYVYGSHDKEGGDAFCLLDYEVWSAPVTDLTDWRCEGISYRKAEDPTLSEKYRDMYAPDVVRGNDGRYYLYYALSGGCFTGPIHVAVSDTPAGPFHYHGCVRNADGSDFTTKITFDPGLINDNGTIRLYYGWSLAIDRAMLTNMDDTFRAKLREVQMKMFEKTPEEIDASPEGVQGAYTVELADDMLTVKTEPKLIVPGQFDAAGTSFDEHAFFEASSMRKIGDTYYFIYSSEQQHELCYATSQYPDRDFVYGGTIVSNGDIGYEGRTMEDRVATTGNDHGSIENINGQWYVFYHRQTHKTTYSRQGCAEKIEIAADGSIKQVPMTSCGLNNGPLPTEGSYSACIACNLTNGRMPHQGTEPKEGTLPHITNDGEARYIAEIGAGTMIGYKYFVFDGATKLTITYKCTEDGVFKVKTSEKGDIVAEIAVKACKAWNEASAELSIEGTSALYLEYEGTGSAELMELSFS